MQAIPLRYFNAAGAESKLRVGEWHEPETHLIPNIFKAARAHQPVSVFGTDYPTPDGTCIRDYIHVSDLALAHESALNKLLALPVGEGFFRPFNLGSEAGYSVREVIAECQKVLRRDLGREVVLEEHPRRAGDAPRLVGDSTRARTELGFKPLHRLDSIVESAWAWEQKRALPRPAVLLDRDGTLNVDPGYIKNAEDLHLLPGAGAALGKLSAAGFPLVIISNQSGVGRGLIPAEAIPLINQRVNTLLAPFGAQILRFQLCFHNPDEGCACRKPGTKLIEEVARDLHLDLARSVFIGDRETDLLAGRASGCGTVILVRTGDGKKTEASLKTGECDVVVDDLSAAADYFLSLA